MPRSEQEKAEKHTRYSDWLGHIDKDGKDDATFKSYMLYSITDLDCLRDN
jgi:hypothetical protein